MEALRDIEFTQVAADWDSARLGREYEPLLLLMRNGLTTDQRKERGELRVTRIETISDGIIDEQKVRWVSGLKPDQIEKYRIQKGDILFSHINSDPHLGKSAIALKHYTDLLHGMNLLLLRANRRVLVPEFLHFVCCYYRTKGVFLKICSRSVNQSSINQAKLKALEIPLPPLPEQRKIAAVLGLVQRAIGQQERLIALTTELKKALLHKLFTEGLRGEPQKQTEIGPVPESWEIVRLEDVCTFLSGGTPSKKNSEFWTGSIPWVSPKDMKMPRLSDVADHISDTALKEGSSLAPVGSVFVVIRGMILAKDVPFALAEVPMAFNQDMKAIISGPRVLPSFLLYALVAFKRNLFRKVGRSSHGTMTLMSSEIAQFLIPLPDRQTQEVIATAIETVERKDEMHRSKHAILSELFRSLLHDFMTAKFRVSDRDVSELSERIDEHSFSPRVADD
jgi:type I restriction enzyme S subunit